MRQLYAIVLILLMLCTTAVASDYYYKNYDRRPELEQMPKYKEYIEKRDSFRVWFKAEKAKPLMERNFEEIERRQKEIMKAWRELNKWLLQFDCSEPKPWR